MKNKIKFIYWNISGKKYARLKVKIGRKSYRCGEFIDDESWVQGIESRGVVTIENRFGHWTSIENVKVKNNYREKV